MTENDERTVWERIFDALKQNGIDVYPPASKHGECTKEYAVVKNDGSSQYQQTSSEAQYYSILLYVPKDRYAVLEKYKQKVKEIVSLQLYPMLMPTGLETPDYYDDTVKAHMVSVQYRNNVRNKHL